MRHVSRTAAVAAAVGIQVLLVVVAVAPRLSARLTGDDYLLRVAPVDPIDPFRGAYVVLSYPDLAPTDIGSQPTGDVFVPLIRDGALWRGGGLRTKRPASGPYLSCRFNGSLRCGIESLFASQAAARSLERELSTGDAVARIKLDRRGHAVVRGIEPR